ncbi:hypothetical protein [Henriciella sp.]|uniref:hypothetical protein n=1 Tax=Henriciella sp. TaxID=1968823 RepID=UPI0026343569|nr:hypothetical protein [Henriciella sp.]
MTAIDWVMMTVAGLSGLVGLALLYSCWKRPGQPTLLAGGWGLLTVSVLLAFFANGDRGIAQASVILMAGATAVFCIPLLRGIAPPVATRRTRQHTGTPKEGHPIRKGLSCVWTFLVTGPLAGVIALLASAALFKLIRPTDGNPATAGVIAIIAAVLIWAMVSVLLLIEPRTGRRSAYAGLALAVTAAIAFI